MRVNYSAIRTSQLMLLLLAGQACALHAESQVNTESETAIVSEMSASAPAQTAGTVTAAATNTPTPKIDSTTVTSWQQAVDEIESNEGPYSDDLSQKLVGLGISYQQRGRHRDAIEVFKRAAHIKRINEGLYSLNQMPILERIVDSQIALGQWAQLSNLNAYLVWLNKRNPDKSEQNIKQMLGVVGKLSQYHLNAYFLDRNHGPFYHLVQAQRMYRLSVNMIDRHFGHTDPRLIEPLRGLSAANYFLTEFSRQTNTELRNKIQMGNFDQRAPSDNYQKYIINNYEQGKEALTHIAEIVNANPSFQPSAALKARVELGDWYLMFDRRRSAMEIYREIVRAEIDDADTRNAISHWFAEPVALPDLGSFESLAGNDSASESFVLVQFDVSAYGRARNVEVLQSFPEDSVRIRSKARENIKRARFRPRFLEGEPVETRGLKQRYLFSAR